mgnify:FL=1|jgi:hypothetical protein
MLQQPVNQPTEIIPEATAAASKEDEKGNLAALIYRGESQLRKKEAAAATADLAKKRKRSTSAAIRRSPELVKPPLAARRCLRP